jgi:hypothetical protein
MNMKITPKKEIEDYIGRIDQSYKVSKHIELVVGALERQVKEFPEDGLYSFTYPNCNYYNEEVSKIVLQSVLKQVAKLYSDAGWQVYYSRSDKLVYISLKKIPRIRRIIYRCRKVKC